MITTEAWVLYAGEKRKSPNPKPGKLCRESFSFPDINRDEVLVEPVYGCWEGNMNHALARNPVDICHQRREDKIVLGNSGVVRIVKVGSDVTTTKEGEYCIVFPTATTDAHGYPLTIYGYDAPGTIGVLAKCTKLHEKNVIPVPASSPHSLAQWAAFSLRYITAWSNWQVAYRCWQAQMGHVKSKDTYVAAWGGGVGLAQCTLAKTTGCRTIMFASQPERMVVGEALGITMINRQEFGELYYDPERFEADANYRKQYRKAEGAFARAIMAQTNGAGVSIFIDNIGVPVYPATLRVLGRQGVLATCGWKHGMEVSHPRAVECINRHIHVHTHYANYAEGLEAVHFANTHEWVPPEPDDIYTWEEIPQLSAEYGVGQINSYFPIFAVNA
ncbi:zinc-binding dehydrogenase [Chloroflexi bacterium TSY]|nr:zinc-binding dehydrogenase [Chloroflexi bacterium TSY]